MYGWDLPPGVLGCSPFYGSYSNVVYSSEQEFIDESVAKIDFLISQPKHMLWVLKNMLEMICKCTLKEIVYLNLCPLSVAG